MTLCAWCYAEKQLGEQCPNGCAPVIVDQPTAGTPTILRFGHVRLYCACCGRITDTRDHLGRCPSCAERTR